MSVHISSSNLPFTETRTSPTTSIRVFTEDTLSGDLMWHRDREDRVIEAIGETDWGFQMDNELPVRITTPITIPKGIYHRLIKGTGDLRLSVTFEV